MSIRIASWNINSIRRRLKLIHKLKKEFSIDILFLQECKCTEHDMPYKELKKLVINIYITMVRKVITVLLFYLTWS